MSFVEYDDQGQLLNKEAKNSVINKYRELSKQNNVMLISFIHGWNHNTNGNPEDDNITEFRRLLELAAWQENQISKNAKRTPRKVLGLYIGWRGRSLPNLLKILSFWDRKSAAHQVGAQGITEFLLEIEAVVKTQNSVGRLNSMVTIGHSFGAAALYSAIHPIMSQRYIDGRRYNKKDNLAGGFGDLVVLVNPAFEAIRHGALFYLSQDDCRAYPGNQLPKLVILSSVADKPVRYAFPLAD